MSLFRYDNEMYQTVQEQFGDVNVVYFITGGLLIIHFIQVKCLDANVIKSEEAKLVSENSSNISFDGFISVGGHFVITMKE